ncbi:class I SAM-dependent methyltransferase [Neorhizobium sp. JUb45]|uniref:class I SAM-dependent methyltransferase n=1 Tax=unclassified Neorhizobium TaxID=2629175 RepID=UPI00104375DA|nr:class I SAM-dependent methyltransferase [Neorhizobium sp. JUb45]TCR00452.1 methyltransferase family protein [Neorhizobium sp. JUb45]
MSGFETRWLDLREPADHAARDAGLLQNATAYADAGGNAVTVVDLGCGTGSTLRAFLPAATRWQWQLVDNDPLLLAEAASRNHNGMTLDCVQTDLGEPSPELFKRARLVTASALLDLVSSTFLHMLVSSLDKRDCGFYTALNFDGRCIWDHAHVADARIVNAFNMHQRRDKGFGPALGPVAEGVLRDILRTNGFRVLTGKSPWRLGAGEVELQRQFIIGMATAAAETGLVDHAVVEDWRNYRLDHADSNCEIGHWDMLALR